MSPKRNVPDCPIFGNSHNLSETVLPTYFHVIKCYLHESQFIKLTTNKDPSVGKISELNVIKIKDLWIKASVPCVFNSRITKIIAD